MAKKEKENLKGMKIDELQKKLTDLRESLRVMRFKTEGSKSKNVKEPAFLKKQIARVLTEINKNNKNK
ncbi:MAG TPA: 50S ribosomal protein L29 [Candidatus Paceibacterota bacterium]|nr:50S ribosomal protein L29 [Candidatus Paceibacterota bacterium]